MTDDELVEIVAREEYEALTMPLYWTDVEERVREGYRKFVRRIIARIRRPLEARGIEAGAAVIRDKQQVTLCSADATERVLARRMHGNIDGLAYADALEALARQHAAGEDAP